MFQTTIPGYPKLSSRLILFRRLRRNEWISPLPLTTRQWVMSNVELKCFHYCLYLGAFYEIMAKVLQFCTLTHSDFYSYLKKPQKKRQKYSLLWRTRNLYRFYVITIRFAESVLIIIDGNSLRLCVYIGEWVVMYSYIKAREEKKCKEKWIRKKRKQKSYYYN